MLASNWLSNSTSQNKRPYVRIGKLIETIESDRHTIKAMMQAVEKHYFCSMSRIARHRASMPNTICPFFIFFVSLLSASQHLARADVCDSSSLLYELCLLFCNFVRPLKFDSQPVHCCCYIRRFYYNLAYFN